jgi:DNA mismatch endonuclease, patch repair protein
MAARYIGLKPASIKASRAAAGSSAKRNTRPELVLRKALREIGLRGYRIDDDSLSGRPDLVFRVARVAVFCDGDFWHGRNLEERVAKLRIGHNAPYWVSKISGNVARDRARDSELTAAGWTVLRFWETDILRNAAEIAVRIREVVAQNRELARKRPRYANSAR